MIWVWAALAVLSEIGVNVAPLIASAGVLGVAIGFGAQSLVKDFLSGIFMLLENQYGVGDTISVNGVEGTVEEMTLRVTTLRDIDGTLWYVRNGEIIRVGNMSQDHAVARAAQAQPDRRRRRGTRPCHRSARGTARARRRLLRPSAPPAPATTPSRSPSPPTIVTAVASPLRGSES
mgnify:CR=1 FL=1